MRIVVDTNTVLSGLLWQGPPRRLLDLGRTHDVTLCTSVLLIEELAEVIARDKFAQRLRTAGLSAKILVQDYARIAELIDPHPLHALKGDSMRKRKGSAVSIETATLAAN